MVWLVERRDESCVSKKVENRCERETKENCVNGDIRYERI